MGYAPDYGGGYAPDYGYDKGYDKGHDKGYGKDYGKDYGYDGGQAVCSYTVQPGDTLAWVAQSMGVSQYDLIAANGIANPDLIYVGQVLSNPNCAAAGYGLGAAPADSYAGQGDYAAAYGADDYAAGYDAAGYEMADYAAAETDMAGYDMAGYDMAGEAMAAAPAEMPVAYAEGSYGGDEMYGDYAAGDYTASGFATGDYAAGDYAAEDIAAYGAGEMAAALPAAGGTYTVAAGDNLSLIAADYGVSVNQLLQVNGIQNPNIIYVGQQLVIP
jgi:lysozyme